MLAYLGEDVVSHSIVPCLAHFVYNNNMGLKSLTLLQKDPEENHDQYLCFLALTCKPRLNQMDEEMRNTWLFQFTI